MGITHLTIWSRTYATPAAVVQMSTAKSARRARCSRPLRYSLLSVFRSAASIIRSRKCVENVSSIVLAQRGQERVTERDLAIAAALALLAALRAARRTASQITFVVMGASARQP